MKRLNDESRRQIESELEELNDFIELHRNAIIREVLEYSKLLDKRRELESLLDL